MLNAGQRYMAYFFLEPTVAVLPEVMVQGTTIPRPTTAAPARPSSFPIPPSISCPI